MLEYPNISMIGRQISLLILLVLGNNTSVFGWIQQQQQSTTKVVSRRSFTTKVLQQHQKRRTTASNNNDSDDVRAGDNFFRLYDTKTNATDQLSDYRDSIGLRGKELKDRDSNRKDMMDVVMKFGGSSIADANRIEHVVQLIKNQIECENVRPRAVVCSAMGKTTNNLLNAGEMAINHDRVCMDAIRTLHISTMNTFNITEEDHTYSEVTDLLEECEKILTGVKLIKELSPKSLDQLVSYGERCSVRIIAHRLNQIGIPCQSFDSWDIGIITNNNYGDATIVAESEQMIKDAFDKIDPNIVAIVTGFIGKENGNTNGNGNGSKQNNVAGRITTLGRGGSDLTATQIGSSIPGISEIQVWKDVDGILTSDPRIVADAKPVSFVTYEEAAELAYFGAQVLHPIAMYPAMKKNVPVRVKNSYNPAAVGTIIMATKKKEDNHLVTAITYKNSIKLLDIKATTMLGQYGFLSKIFTAFEKHKVSVDVLASSEVSVSLTLDKKQKEDDLQLLMNDLRPFAELTMKENRSILTLITDVERSSEVLAIVFRIFVLKNIKVEMMSQGASKVNISFIVPDDQLQDAMLSIHDCFFGNKCIVSSEPMAATTTDGDVATEEELYISKI